MLAPCPIPAAPRRRPARMPFRHKLMLALACELVLLGFGQAHRNAHRAGILIEIPDQAHHVVT